MMADDDDFVPDSEDFLDDEVSSIVSKGKASRKRQVKPKVVSDWTDTDIFKLISCVEALPMLWNAGDAKYRNKIDRQSAWKEMSETNFDNKFSATELMAKWSNIRIQYRSYDSKLRKTKSGQGAVEQVKWKFFDVMSFVGRAEATQTAMNVSNLVGFSCLRNLLHFVIF